jgi:hypothetical protein
MIVAKARLTAQGIDRQQPGGAPSQRLHLGAAAVKFSRRLMSQILGNSRLIGKARETKEARKPTPLILDWLYRGRLSVSRRG